MASGTERYQQVLALGCFRFEELQELTGSRTAAHSLLQRYAGKGYIRSVRRNLYVAVNPLDGQPVASKYLIASKITAGAYVALHAAFAYHGVANQVSYRMDVASQVSFRPFSFEGIQYQHVRPLIDEGVMTGTDGVRVTDIERTVIDSINAFTKDMGLEELLNCLALIPTLDEAKLLRYLALYDKQMLYQKTGFILEPMKDDLRLSEAFFTSCRDRVKRSKRYIYPPLPSERLVYDKRWRLMAPERLSRPTSPGAVADAEI